MSPTSNGWLSIETAPRDGSKVLLWSRLCGWPSGSYDVYKGYWEKQIGLIQINDEPHMGWFSTETDRDSFDYDEAKRLSPTHWQPLPAPPADGGE